jgi:hypothetical protein
MQEKEDFPAHSEHEVNWLAAQIIKLANQGGLVVTRKDPADDQIILAFWGEGQIELQGCKVGSKVFVNYGNEPGNKVFLTLWEILINHALVSDGFFTKEETAESEETTAQDDVRSEVKNKKPENKYQVFANKIIIKQDAKSANHVGPLLYIIAILNKYGKVNPSLCKNQLSWFTSLKVDQDLQTGFYFQSWAKVHWDPDSKVKFSETNPIGGNIKELLDPDKLCNLYRRTYKVEFKDL